jgi:hypothetical protein
LHESRQKCFFIRAISVIRGFSLFAISVAKIEKLIGPGRATRLGNLTQEIGPRKSVAFRAEKERIQRRTKIED